MYIDSIGLIAFSSESNCVYESRRKKKVLTSNFNEKECAQLNFVGIKSFFVRRFLFSLEHFPSYYDV